MDNNIPRNKDIANWNPGNGGVDSDSKKAKLFSTEAHDSPEVMTATNDLKRAVGSSKKPSGPFGIRGQQF
jgi:hypothetical protein